MLALTRIARMLGLWVFDTSKHEKHITASVTSKKEDSAVQQQAAIVLSWHPVPSKFLAMGSDEDLLPADIKQLGCPARFESLSLAPGGKGPTYPVSGSP